MKKTIAALCLLTTISYGQITFENTYNIPVNGIEAYKFGNTDTKYITLNQSSNLVTIFNQNHSVYKSFTIPTQPSSFFVGFYSETLFNNDNLVEYMVSHNTNVCGLSTYKMKIYNENGTIVFQKDSLSIIPSVIKNTFFNSPQGTKMILNQYVSCAPNQLASSVYSLGGQLYTKVKDNDGLNQNEFRVFPNPSSNYFKVEYKLPVNTTEGLMEIYNIQGQLMKSYKLSNQLTDILIESTELQSGSYIVKIQADNNVISNKIIKL
jgi:hypothetical protein